MDLRLVFAVISASITLSVGAASNETTKPDVEASTRSTRPPPSPDARSSVAGSVVPSVTKASPVAPPVAPSVNASKIAQEHPSRETRAVAPPVTVSNITQELRSSEGASLVPLPEVSTTTQEPSNRLAAPLAPLKSNESEWPSFVVSTLSTDLYLAPFVYTCRQIDDVSIGGFGEANDSAYADLKAAQVARERRERAVARLHAAGSTFQQLDTNASNRTNGSSRRLGAAMERAIELTNARDQARAAQIQEDIARVVNATLGVMNRTSSATTKATEALLKAEALRSRLNKEHECAEETGKNLSRQATELNETLKEKVAELVEEGRRLQRDALKREASLLSERAVFESFQRKRKEQLDNRTRELEIRIAEQRELAKNITMEATRAEELLDELKTKQKEQEAQLAEINAAIKNSTELRQKAEKEMEQARQMQKNASVLEHESIVQLQRASSVRDTAVAMKKKEDEEKASAHQLLLQATAMKELAETQMSDALSVVSGLDPRAQSALRKAFDAQKRSLDVLQEAKERCPVQTADGRGTKLKENNKTTARDHSKLKQGNEAADMEGPKSKEDEQETMKDSNGSVPQDVENHTKTDVEKLFAVSANAPSSNGRSLADVSWATLASGLVFVVPMLLGCFFWRTGRIFKQFRGSVPRDSDRDDPYGVVAQDSDVEHPQIEMHLEQEFPARRTEPVFD